MSEKISPIMVQITIMHGQKILTTQTTLFTAVVMVAIIEIVMIMTEKKKILLSIQAT